MSYLKTFVQMRPVLLLTHGCTKIMCKIQQQRDDNAAGAVAALPGSFPVGRAQIIPPPIAGPGRSRLTCDTCSTREVITCRVSVTTKYTAPSTFPTHREKMCSGKRTNAQLIRAKYARPARPGRYNYFYRLSRLLYVTHPFFFSGCYCPQVSEQVSCQQMRF